MPATWLFQFGIAAMVAIVGYFLKRAADALEKVDARGQSHETSIKLIQAEQLQQNAQIAANAADIDRNVLRSMLHDEKEASK